MTVIEIIDTAYPSSLGGSLHGAQGLCFYAGGDALHIWTTAELSAIISEAKPWYLLPVFVRSDPGSAAQGTADGESYAAALKDVYKAPQGILAALDIETAIDPAYVSAFSAALRSAGYVLIVYGSQDTVRGNDASYYWGADWTGQSGILPGDAATQYVHFSTYDLSDFGGQLPLWRIAGARPPVTVLPGIPSGIRAQVVTSDYRITWEPVLYPFADRIPGNYAWQVQLYKGNGDWELIRSGAGPETSAMVRGIEPERELRYRVSGGNWSGWFSLIS